MAAPIALGTALKIAGISTGAQLGLQYLLSSRDRVRSIRRHQQQFRPEVGSFGKISSPEGPFPVLWGPHERYTPQLFYAQVTTFETMVRGQNDPVGTKNQPATGRRVHLCYLVTLGRAQEIEGVFIDFPNTRSLTTRPRTRTGACRRRFRTTARSSPTTSATARRVRPCATARPR